MEHSQTNLKLNKIKTTYQNNLYYKKINSQNFPFKSPVGENVKVRHKYRNAQVDEKKMKYNKKINMKF